MKTKKCFSALVLFLCYIGMNAQESELSEKEKKISGAIQHMIYRRSHVGETTPGVVDLIKSKAASYEEVEKVLLNFLLEKGEPMKDFVKKEGLRDASIGFLGAIKSQKALPLLKKMINESTDKDIKYSCAIAILNIEDYSPDALEDLYVGDKYWGKTKEMVDEKSTSLSRARKEYSERMLEGKMDLETKEKVLSVMKKIALDPCESIRVVRDAQDFVRRYDDKSRLPFSPLVGMKEERLKYARGALREYYAKVKDLPVEERDKEELDYRAISVIEYFKDKEEISLLKELLSLLRDENKKEIITYAILCLDNYSPETMRYLLFGEDLPYDSRVRASVVSHLIEMFDLTRGFKGRVTKEQIKVLEELSLNPSLLRPPESSWAVRYLDQYLVKMQGEAYALSAERKKMIEERLASKEFAEDSSGRDYLRDELRKLKRGGL